MKIRPLATALVAALIAVPVVVVSAGAGADHCRPGADSEVDGVHTCLTDLDELFGNDDTTPDTTGDTTGDTTPDTAGDTTGSTTLGDGADDDSPIADVGAALLDAVDDGAFPALIRNKRFAEGIGCPNWLRGDPCAPIDDAIAAVKPLLEAGAHVLPATLVEAAVLAAVRDPQGQLVFPSLAASLPVIFQLTIAGAEGDEQAALVARRFTTLLASLDARARGLAE